MGLMGLAGRCLFPLGRVVATPGALTALQKAGVTASLLLDRHKAGDWGDIVRGDIGENERALADGERIFSVYRLQSTGEVVWVITERDRSATTLLLPKDY